MYCQYNDLRYKIKKRDRDYIIIYRLRKEGFINYIDILGNEHFDLYMKRVKANEVDIIYKEDVFIKFKDVYFQLFANKILKEDVLDNSYMIWTASDQIAQKYNFEKKEQFVFTKYITRNEIEAIKIIKKPILEFKDRVTLEEIFEGDKLDEWLTKLI